MSKHMRHKGSVEERFWAKVDEDGPAGCWIWLAYKEPYGYGRFMVDKKPRRAHRMAYEYLRGPIQPGLVLDHLCRNPSCVNPDHLEAVTQRENTIRGMSGQVNAARLRALTHCKHGHEFTPENTYTSPRGRRACRTCESARQSRRWVA